MGFWRPRRWPIGTGPQNGADFRWFRVCSSHGDPIQATAHFFYHFLFLGEIGFRRNRVFIVVKPQTATTKMTVASVRSFYVFNQNCDLGLFFTSQTRISYGRPTLLIFCIINSFHHVFIFHRDQYLNDRPIL